MKTYHVRTFGCQMNKHDSERVAGLLESMGLEASPSTDDADVIVFMTCCVRENADDRLHGQVASLKARKSPERVGPIIAVGGCIGQRDGQTLLDGLPHVDVVFGTHNIAHLPALIDSVLEGQTHAVEVLESSTDFASDLPTVREHPWHAWVPITVGCNNFCTYCIVPYVRGRERSRDLEDVVSECDRLHSEGVAEVTLLGQNVNSYGRDLYGAPRFADLLRRVGATGIARIRFATSHPKDLSDDTIRAMAETPGVARYLHLPVQSGSNRILRSMNRTYTREHYLELVTRIRNAMPDIALSTDIIVGFPGETEQDFEDTLDLMRQVGFDQAFTFIYSPRTGTPAAKLDGRIPRDVSQARFDRLVDVVHSSALTRNAALVDSVQHVLIEGPSKRDEDMLSGRTSGNKVVHTPVPAGRTANDYAGRFIDIRITEAQKWFLLGDIEGDTAS